MWRRANKVHLFTIDSHCFQVLLLLYWTWQSSGNQANSAYFKPITRPVLLVVCNISDNLVCSSNLIARENCKQILLLPAMGTQSNCNRIAYKFSHQHLTYQLFLILFEDILWSGKVFLHSWEKEGPWEQGLHTFSYLGARKGRPWHNLDKIPPGLEGCHKGL